MNTDADSQSEIYNNNNKIIALCQIKKTLVYYLIQQIIEWGDTKYVNLDIEKYHMNKIIVNDITSKYDYIIDEENNDIVCIILTEHGFDFVTLLMVDKRLSSINDIFNNMNPLYIESISSTILIHLIDENIQLLIKINNKLLNNENTNNIENKIIFEETLESLSNVLNTHKQDSDIIFNCSIDNPIVHESFIKEYNNKTVYNC